MIDNRRWNLPRAYKGLMDLVQRLLVGVPSFVWHNDTRDFRDATIDAMTPEQFLLQ